MSEPIQLRRVADDGGAELGAEMLGIVERHASSDGVHETPIAPLRLIRRGAPTEFMNHIQKPALWIIVQGRQDVRLHGESYCLNAHGQSKYLLATTVLPLAVRIAEASPQRPCLCARLDMEPRSVHRLVAGLPLPGPSAGARAGGLYAEPLEPSLLESMLRLLRLLDTPGDISTLAPLAYTEVLYRVLRGGQGHRLLEIAAADMPAHRVMQAVEWLDRHYTQTLRIDELAQRINLCNSSLHHRFKEVTGLSPLQYQKRLRLQEARRLMSQEGLEVSAACYRVGYESPSQFSREYSRLFGVSPRSDIATLREVDG